jgi:hypothetical protein
MNERHLWALIMIRKEESKYKEELLALIYPIVLHVVDGKLLQTDSIEVQFGQDVSTIEDLLSDINNDRRYVHSSVAKLVEEVEATNTPAKRDLTIWPRGASQVFNCTVCGVPAFQPAGTVLGIQIKETWPVKERTDIATDNAQSIVGLPDENPSEGAPSQSMGNPKMVSFDSVSIQKRERVLDIQSSNGVSKQSNYLMRYSASQVIFRNPLSTFMEHAIGVAYPGVVEDTPVDIWYRHRLLEICHDDTDQKMISATEAEANILSRCRHPNILMVVGMAYMEEGPALLLEPSACSVEFLLEKKRFPIPSALRILSQVASAIAYLHRSLQCYGVLDAAHVVLMNCSVEEPVAKLSNFSRSRRAERGGVRGSPLLANDIADLLAFLKRLLLDGSDNSFSAKPIQIPHLTERESIRITSETNDLISNMEAGSLTAAEITKKLIQIEMKVYPQDDIEGFQSWSV